MAIAAVEVFERDAATFDSTAATIAGLGTRFGRADAALNGVSQVGREHWDLDDRWEIADDADRGPTLAYRVATDMDAGEHFYMNLAAVQLAATPSEHRGRLLSYHVAQVAHAVRDHGTA